MNTLPDGKQERLDSIQILRALAALAVIWSHSSLELLRFTDVDLRSFSSVSSMGRMGVDIFFVISGFVMVYVSSRHFQERGEAIRFALRRIARVVPIYWFYTSLILLVAVFAPRLLREVELSWSYVAASYLFIPLRALADGGLHPLLGIGWTLNYEMYFYLLFAPFLIFARGRAVMALAGLFAVIVLLGRFLDPSADAFWFWSRPIILEFAAGALLALAYLNRWRISLSVATVLIAAGIAWVLYVAEYWNQGNLDDRLIATGIPSILIVAGFVMRRRPDRKKEHSHFSRGFIELGNASYSLYLVHMFVIRALTQLVPADALGVFYPVVYMTGVFALCIVAAIISYRLIELPSNDFLRRQMNI